MNKPILIRKILLYRRFYGKYVRRILSPSYIMHWFFASVLCGIVIFIAVFATDTEAILFKRAQMPLIELYDFDIYNANDTIVSSHAKGLKALRYADYEISYETILSLIQDTTRNNSATEYIYGQEVRRVQNTYFFDIVGIYAKDNGETFWSARASYDITTKIFSGSGRFWIASIEGSAEGKNIIYNQKLQTMNAQDVRAHIDLSASKGKK